MRQTIREIEVNVAYRWFQGLDILDGVPHFQHLGKITHVGLKVRICLNRFFAYLRRMYEISFSGHFCDLCRCHSCKSLCKQQKMRNRIAKQEALWYEEELKKKSMKIEKHTGKAFKR